MGPQMITIMLIVVRSIPQGTFMSLDKASKQVPTMILRQSSIPPTEMSYGPNTMMDQRTDTTQVNQSRLTQTVMLTLQEITRLLPAWIATLKYSTNGELLWGASYDGPDNGGDVLISITLDDLANAYVCGFVASG